MMDILHGAWIILGVVLFVELVRQSWRANRCRAQARQCDAERDAASPDRKTSRLGFETLHHLRRQEDHARLWAWAYRMMAVVVVTVWVALAWK